MNETTRVSIAKTRIYFLLLINETVHFESMKIWNWKKTTSFHPLITWIAPKENLRFPKEIQKKASIKHQPSTIHLPFSLGEFLGLSFRRGFLPRGFPPVSKAEKMRLQTPSPSPVKKRRRKEGRSFEGRENGSKCKVGMILEWWRIEFMYMYIYVFIYI